MNFRRIERVLRKYLNGRRGLSFEYEVKDNRLEAKNSITIEGYKGDILFSIKFYQNGMARYCYTFDKLNRTPQVAEMLMDFNSNFPFFKAYIDGGYLRVDHVAYIINEKDVEEYTSGIMSEILADNCKKYLAPISELTYP